jgi:hypothetical protein
MALKEKLIENKKINEQIKFAISEQQSRLSYELGYSDSKVEAIDYAELFDPFIKQYADMQLALTNGTSENPVYDRKFSDLIMSSVENVKVSLENMLGNTEVWGEMVQSAGIMGGLDLMGTPVSRFLSLSIMNGDLAGKVEIKAVDNDINKLAWEIYEKDGKFVERIYLNKLNELSETQDMFVSIPNTLQQNEGFKLSNPEIFEQKQIGGDEANKVLTGGVTEVYRKKKKDGELEINTKDLDGGMVQDFYIIDKELIGNSIQFNTELDKITAGLLEEFQSFDQVIAFNNNIIAEVTNHYLKPAKALRDNEQKRFQEDYKKWFLETQVGKEYPMGSPKPKQQEEQPMQQPQVVQEEIVEEQVVS